jgi:hypothetical protein
VRTAVGLLAVFGALVIAVATLAPLSDGTAGAVGAAAQLAFVQQPSDAATGATITPAVTVYVEDASGNLETGDNTTAMQLTIANNPSGATLAGGSPVAVVGGIATFSGLSIDTAGTGYTLRAISLPQYSPAISSSFTIGAGPPPPPPPPPTITAISPNAGAWSGGTPLTVTGTDFQSGDQLCFYTPPPVILSVGCASSVSVSSQGTSISATSPALAPDSSAHSVIYNPGIQRCCPDGTTATTYNSSIPYVFEQSWGMNTAATHVVVNPHVLFLLVGNWWCPLVSANPSIACRSKAAQNVQSSTQSSFLGAQTSLVQKDYSSDYDSALASFAESPPCVGTSCPPMFVGPGIGLRTGPGGQPFAGPVDPTAVQCANTKNLNNCNEYQTFQSVIKQFALTPTDVADTVFVLLYAPNQISALAMSPPSKSATAFPNLNCGTHALSGNGPFLNTYSTANVYLEDQNDYCSSAAEIGLFSEVGPLQFATWALSHELDEAITDPGGDFSGWINGTEQIGDQCQFRNGAGDTNLFDGGAFTLGNFTTDSLGTVVAAYLTPTLGVNYCTPVVSTGPPSSKY